MVSVKAMLAKVTFTGDACGGVDIDLGNAGAVGSVGTVVGLVDNGGDDDCTGCH